MKRLCPVARAARLHGDRPALSFGPHHWTWSELEADVRRTVHALKGLGVRRGDRVAWVSGNAPAVFLLAAALPRLGAMGVPLNARLTSAEFEPLLARIQPRQLFVDRDLALSLPGAGTFPELDASADGEPLPDEVDDEDTAIILFTSGTTGTPKGAELPLRCFLTSASASAQRLGESPSDRWLCTLPLFHVGGLAMFWRAARVGASLLLYSRFEPDPVRRALEEEKVTHLSLVDLTLGRLLEAPGPRRFPARLRAALVGGGPVSERRMAEARERGLPVRQTYGMTETASQVCTQLPDDVQEDAGPPLPGWRVRVVDEGGASVPEGSPGLVEVTGPALFRGYWEEPAATAAAFTPDGWLRTGDWGVLDAQERLRVLSRRTDLIVRGGENVYPVEVERVLLTFPGVTEAAVLAVPDAHWGQLPWAFVVADPEGPSEASLLAFCRTRLATYKVPARVLRTEALPRNAMGKVDRTALQALANALSPGA